MANRLSGADVKGLQNALLSGFSYDELKQLVKFEMNEALDAIVPPGAMSSVVFGLIVWVEQHGRMAEFVKAAMAARPHNPDIAALGRLVQPPSAAAAGAAAASPAVKAADQKRRLRGLLLDQFPRKTDLKLVLNDYLGQDLDGVAGGDNHTEVCLNLVNWLWIDPAGRLQPFLAGAVQERPNNKELKALQQELFPG